MTRLKFAFLAVFLCCGVYALAASAPWFKWQSIYDGDVICSQSWPGEGWEQGAGKFNSYSGPFKDAKCTLRGTPSN